MNVIQIRRLYTDIKMLEKVLQIKEYKFAPGSAASIHSASVYPHYLFKSLKWCNYCRGEYLI